MITLNVQIRVKPGGREELIEAGRVLFDELAKEPTFLDAWIHTSEDEPDLIFVYERWKETKESFVQNLLPKPYYKPYEAVLERVGGKRQVVWLDTSYAWRS
ncbi:MAG: antibiotic biosynthesis monooxygenase family protein [Chthoniobacteraceae bacterium]